MNSMFPEEENITISDNYYILVKQLSEDYLKYITNYKIATGDYLKKISFNQEKLSPKLDGVKDQFKNNKNINSTHIISLTSIVPKVIEQQIINTEYFVEGLDKKLDKFERLLKEKNTQFLDCQNSYKEVKNELNKKYKDIEKIKINYMTNITLVEENVHKFYMKKSKKKGNSKQNLSQIENGNDISFSTSEEQVNSSILKTQRIEEDYKNNVLLVQNYEKTYIEMAQKSKEKSRKILSEIANSLKEFISDSIIFLKNIFKLPLSEIDTYINEIVSLDEYSKFDNIIKASYKIGNNLVPIIPEKYTLKFFISKSDSNNINNNSKNGSIKNSINKINVEEDLQEMDYYQEEEMFMTIKKMMEKFELLDNNNFDIISEEEKLRCKYLTLKILSFAPTNKIYANQIPNITQEEVKEIDGMLQKKQNRVIFIQKLSQFRTRGIFEIPEKEYKILSLLFNTIVQIVEKDQDYDSAVNVIILSQTYYVIKNKQKQYLQKAIMDNKLFKTKQFWETYANYSITKEITISKKTDLMNGVTYANNKEKEEKYSNIVFAQLVPMADNMIEFGLDINIVEEIIFPFIKKYKISPEFEEVVRSTITMKKMELQLK